jgi:hypothetical protein
VQDGPWAGRSSAAACGLPTGRIKIVPPSSAVSTSTLTQLFGPELLRIFSHSFGCPKEPPETKTKEKAGIRTAPNSGGNESNGLHPTDQFLPSSAEWLYRRLKLIPGSLPKRKPGQGDLAPNSVVSQTKLGSGREAECRSKNYVMARRNRALFWIS